MATKRVRAHNLQPQFLLEFSVCSSVFLSNSECLGLWVCLWWLLYISCSFDSLVSHGLQRRFFLPVSRAHRVTIVLPGYFSWIPECAFAHLTVIESNVLSMCFRSVIFMMLELHQYINNIFFPISIEQVKRSIAKRQNSVSNKNIKVKWSYYVQWISRFILPILLMFSISSGRLNAVACVLHIKLYSHTTLLEYAVVCLTFQ